MTAPTLSAHEQRLQDFQLYLGEVGKLAAAKLTKYVEASKNGHPNRLISIAAEVVQLLPEVVHFIINNPPKLHNITSEFHFNLVSHPDFQTAEKKASAQDFIATINRLLLDYNIQPISVGDLTFNPNLTPVDAPETIVFAARRAHAREQVAAKFADALSGHFVDLKLIEPSAKNLQFIKDSIKLTETHGRYFKLELTELFSAASRELTQKYAAAKPEEQGALIKENELQKLVHGYVSKLSAPGNLAALVATLNNYIAPEYHIDVNSLPEIPQAKGRGLGE